MRRIALLCLIAGAISGCNSSSSPSGSAAPTADEAKKFIDNVNATSLKLGHESGQASWVQSTYITDDTEAISARANQAFIDTMAKFAKDAMKFDKVEVAPVI